MLNRRRVKDRPHGLHCNRRRMIDAIRTPNLIRRIPTLFWEYYRLVILLKSVLSALATSVAGREYPVNWPREWARDASATHSLASVPWTSRRHPFTSLRSHDQPGNLTPTT